MVAPLVMAAAFQAGGDLIGGALQGRAAEKAKDAQIHAQMQAEQRIARATEEARRLQGPYMQAGYTGINALTRRLGLPGEGVVDATNASGAGADWQAYGRQNPDVMNAARQAVGRGEFGSEEEFYRDHYYTHGQGEGRELPTYGGQVVNNPTQAEPAGGPGGPVGNALTGGNTYGDAANPTAPAPYEAPAPYQRSEFEFAIDDFTKNPAYQFAMEQGSGQVMANAAATGALRSGAALKALQDRGQKTAYQFFDNERNFAYGKHRDDRDFDYGQYIDGRNFGYTQSRDGRRDYEDNRNYLTGRYDRETDDLFRYTGMGQNAAGVVTNAALGQGTQGANLSLAGGDSRAGNALQQGSIWSGVAGDLAGLASSYLNGRGGLNSYMRGAVNSRPDLF